MRKIFLLFTLFLSVAASAQELNCSVTVNTDKVGATNNQVFKTLQRNHPDQIERAIGRSLPRTSYVLGACSLFAQTTVPQAKRRDSLQVTWDSGGELGKPLENFF